MDWFFFFAFAFFLGGGGGETTHIILSLAPVARYLTKLGDSQAVKQINTA